MPKRMMAVHAAFQPTMNSPPTIWTQTCRPLSSIAPPPEVSPNASVPSTVAKRPARSARSCVNGHAPVRKPPSRPVIMCVWKTSATSSTWRKMRILRLSVKVAHGIEPEQTPMMIAPQPATTPAAGVIATRPVIMPCRRQRMHQRRRAHLHRADDGGFPSPQVVQEGPRQERHRRAQVRVDDGDAGIRRGRVRVTTVEACASAGATVDGRTGPSHPQQTGAEHQRDDRVRRVAKAVNLHARANDGGRDKAGGARRDVNDIAARVVDDPLRASEAERRIDGPSW